MAAPVSMQTVVSTCASALGYDEEASTLYVTFNKSGDTYAYDGVPVSTFNSLLRARSIGSELRSQVFSRYAGQKV